MGFWTGHKALNPVFIKKVSGFTHDLFTVSHTKYLSLLA